MTFLEGSSSSSPRPDASASLGQVGAGVGLPSAVAVRMGGEVGAGLVWMDVPGSDRINGERINGL